MNSTRLLLDNLRRKALTVLFPERPAAPSHYRGLVQNDQDRCTGCGACAHVCTSGAIEILHDIDSDHWIYDAARCTFCGRCADACPFQAIAMAATPPPAYLLPGDLRTVVVLPHSRCSDCGRLFVAASRPVLERAFDEVSDAVVRLASCCPECRSKRTASLWLLNN